MKSLFLTCAAWLAAFGLTAGSAIAGSSTWTGNSNTNWTAGGNWTNGVPSGTTTAAFSSATSRAPVIGSPATAGELLFSGSSNQGISGTGLLTLDGIGNLAILNQTTSFTPTISAPLALGANGSGTEVFEAAGSGTAGLNLTGTLNLAAAGNFQIAPENSGSTITFGGAIAGNSGATQISTTGAGLVIFGAANTFASDSVAVGGTSTLRLTNSGAVGASNRVSVASGAALQLANNGTVANFASTLSGTGVGSNGALENQSGSNTYGGAITLAAGTRINADSGTSLTLNGTISGSGQALTVGGSGTTTLAGAIQTGSGTFTKDGTGTVTVSGTNTFTGATTVSAGTLQLQNASALGGSAGGAVGVAGGATLALAGGINVTGQNGLLTLNSNASATSATLTNGGGNNSWQGNLALGGNATISSGPGVLYIGAGYLGAGNAGNYANTISLGANTLTLTAAGTPSGAPSYQGDPGNVYDNSDLMVNSAISGSGGLNLTGVGTITLGNEYSSTYSGPTHITILGTVIVDAAPGVTGLAGTQISVGTAGGVDAAPLTVLQTGDSSSPPGSSYVIGTYNPANNTSNANLTIYGNGVFNMVGSSQGLASLTLDGGTVSGQTTGQLYSPQLTVGTGGVTTLGATAQTSLIENGILAMIGNGFTYSVANGNVTGGATPGVDLVVSDKIVNGYGYTGSGSGSGFTAGGQGIGLVKTGTGTMVISSDNSTGYQGVTQINQGALNIQNNNALGQTGSFYGDLTNSVQVTATGAQLQLQGGLTLATDKTVVLNGSGISTTGALRNIDVAGGTNATNTNTVQGEIILGSSSQINADHGSTLDLTNASGPSALSIVGSGSGGQALTFGGGGTTVVNGAIGGTSALVGTVTVNATDGTNLGTVVLAGTDNYTGATSVTHGALEVASSGALATATTVASGASLLVAQDYNTQNNITVSSGVGLTISGTGTAGAGAIENVSGSNTVAGGITLAAASTIKADAGSSLTLGGAIGGTNQNLTVGGAGSMVVTGSIGTGTGTLTKVDSGTVTLSSSGTNGYTGLTTISAGTLALGASNQLNATNLLTVAAGATFNLNGSSQTLFSGVNLSTAGPGNTNFALGTGTANISFGTAPGSSTLTLSGTGTVDYSGTLSGYGTLVIGAGVNLTLESSGVLIGGKYNIDDANLNIVLAGGTLSLNGTNDVLGSLTFESSTSNLNFAGGSSVVDFTGTVSAGSPSSTLQVQNWTNSVDYFYAGTEPGGGQGTAPLNQIVFDTPTWTGANTTWEAYDSGPDAANQITPVPEPATYGALMVGFAVALAAWTARRRRSEKSKSA